MNWMRRVSSVLLATVISSVAAGGASRNTGWQMAELSKPGPAACIDDAAMRQHWRPERSAVHPDWPAKLVMISGSCDERQGPEAQGRMAKHLSIVVRQGDVLAVSEENAALLAELQAVALSSGGRGGVIRVRLRFAGKVLRARIVAPGKAVLIGDMREVR